MTNRDDIARSIIIPPTLGSIVIIVVAVVSSRYSTIAIVVIISLLFYFGENGLLYFLDDIEPSDMKEDERVLIYFVGYCIDDCCQMFAWNSQIRTGTRCL